MDFNKQGRKLSSNAQLLVMAVHDSDRAKFDTEKFDTTKFEIAQNKPFDLPSLQEKRGRGRPRKNPIEDKPTNDFPSLQEKRGRGRPRKNPIEDKPTNDFPSLQEQGIQNPIKSEIQINLKEDYITDIKEKLELLETITNGYREIERIDKETRKNVKKLCSMMNN